MAGDLFDPAGTLTGGAADARGGLLASFAALTAARAALRQAEAELQGVAAQLKECTERGARHAKLAATLAQAKHKADIALQRVQASPAGQVRCPTSDVAC